MRGGRKLDRHTLTEGDRGGAGWGGERERMNYFYLFFFGFVRMFTNQKCNAWLNFGCFSMSNQ